MYDPENREEVNFYLFAKDAHKTKCFIYAIIYGLMYDKLNGQNIELDKASETLGEDFFLKLKQVESNVMLDHLLFGYFENCRLINNILCEKNYFLRFYKRRNKFRFQLRQKLKTKSEMRRELSSCAIQKFNG